MKPSANVEKYKRVYELRKSGMSFENIGKECGICEAKAFQMFQRWQQELLLQEVQNDRTEDY